MEAYIELFVGHPIGDPFVLSADLLADGKITKINEEKIVIKDGSGGKAVFYGEFTLVGMSITGTMTGFKVKDQGVMLMEGGGYEVDAEDLLAALEGGGDPGPELEIALEKPVDIFTLLAPDGLLVKGSKFGDQLVEIDVDGATVRGRGGDDYLVGGKGNQVIKGGKGNDLVAGAGEKDKLYGGKGSDSFLFGGSGVDASKAASIAAHKIKDFSHADDTIHLIGVEIDPGFLDDDYFKKGTTATSEDHRIIYDKGTGKVHYDPDGSATDSEQIHFASVKAGTKVKADDIFVSGLLF